MGLERFLGAFRDAKPFRVIDGHVKAGTLVLALKNAGIGCQTIRAKSLQSLLESHLDLRTCTVDQLEQISGVGPKTSRFFILHSRLNARVAALDVHILRYLKSLGYNVPTVTPTGKNYRKIEEIFLQEADKSGMTVADFDLFIWNMSTAKKIKNV